jgi:hypothetical protein
MESAKGIFQRDLQLTEEDVYLTLYWPSMQHNPAEPRLSPTCARRFHVDTGKCYPYLSAQLQFAGGVPFKRTHQ